MTETQKRISKNGKKIGRPTSYTPELGTEICKRIALGESLRSVCKDEGMPAVSSVMLWILDAEKKMFSEQYARAREAQAELLFDETLEIADDGTNDWQEKEVGSGRKITLANHEHINRSRLRVDTRKWYLSKVLPKKFGEKLDISNNGDSFHPGVIILPQRNENTLETPTETGGGPSEN